MKRFSSILSAALLTLVVMLGALPASAATTSSGQSSGLSIQPRKNYTIKAGESITDKLTIGNLDDADTLNISLRMIDFTYTDQTGTPKLFLAQNAPQTTWSLKPFTTLPKTVQVGPGDTKTVQFSIKVPKNQGAGSYYGAIIYQAAGTNGGNVALNASGATLVFVSVPGIVQENMTLQKYGAYTSDNGGVTGSFTYIATNAQPQQLAFALKNQGNVAESPAGSIVVKDTFGHTVSTIDSINPNSSLALIGQDRLFQTCIKSLQEKIKLEGGTTKSTACTDPGLMPGRYTAHLDLFYGQNGNQTREITATATFWILPWWFIILCLIILLAIVYGIWRLKRKIQSVVKGTTYKSDRGVSRFKRRR